ncbi:hypothetical protein HU200_000967 [Digitaria exilis]|uniref:Uncharacterized protein n=1 Tax=Digitaria exilis TaxID=1010633 RepID=A0A835KWU3_9POAL|nr:hypothetical protein HU200_000967 [Digitaria exilis]
MDRRNQCYLVVPGGPSKDHQGELGYPSPTDTSLVRNSEYPYDGNDEIIEGLRAGIGGPLVDYDGNFMGMNFYDPKVGTPFLLCDDIVDILDCLKTRRTRAEIDSFRIDGDDNVSMNEWPVPLPCWQHPGGPDGIDEHDRKIIASGRKFKYCGGQIWICK